MRRPRETTVVDLVELHPCLELEKREVEGRGLQMRSPTTKVWLPDQSV
jgi:hypothetical protein